MSFCIDCEQLYPHKVMYTRYEGQVKVILRNPINM